MVYEYESQISTKSWWSNIEPHHLQGLGGRMFESNVYRIFISNVKGSDIRWVLIVKRIKIKHLMCLGGLMLKLQIFTYS